MEISKDLIAAAQIDAVAIAVAAERLEKAAFFYGGQPLVLQVHEKIRMYSLQQIDILQAIQRVYKEMYEWLK